MSQRGKGATIIVLFAVVLLCFGIRSRMMASARKEIYQPTQDLSRQETAFQDLSKKLETAKGKHRPEYLVDVSLDGSKASLFEANSLLEMAKKANHPDLVRRYARQAQANVSQAGGGLDDIRARLDFLDTALADYQKAPETVKGRIGDYELIVKGLRQEGYFAENFIDSERLIAAARDRLQLVSKITKKILADGRCDYVAAYRASLDGGKFAADAREIAEAVPALRQANDERIAKLPESYNRTRQAYEPAWFAAKNLESYPVYRCLSQVEQAHSGMLQIDELRAQSASLNSMQTQNFKAAARTVSQAENNLAQALAIFERASDSWQKVEEALNTCASVRLSAVSAIDRAETHANEWRHENSQGRADDLISQAQAALTAGDMTQTSDPPKALAHFQSAEDLADEAYNAVDTSTRPPVNTSWGSSDDSGGGLLGGGGGGGLLGGGGGGGGGFGGGFDSGPIGGGADFGPTGGGVGSGDF